MAIPDPSSVRAGDLRRDGYQAAPDRNRRLRRWEGRWRGIGCRQGLEVGGDVESLGRRVTAAVVHAIFAIILIDAIFALIYMEFDI